MRPDASTKKEEDEVGEFQCLTKLNLVRGGIFQWQG